MTATVNASASLPAKPELARRAVLKAMAVAGGGFAVGLARGAGDAQAQPVFDASTWPGQPAEAFEYWLEIASDNIVTINVHLAEMGQGILTAVAMLVAEELEADWPMVRTRFAPNGQAYYNRGYSIPMESTGGSASIRGAFPHSRAIGASAREMLRLAAARQWNVPVEETRAEKSFVHHDLTSRRLSYGALAADAAKMTPPDDVLMKPKSQWSIIGRSQKRLDTPAKVDGSAQFGSDVQVDGMLTAAIRHCPTYDGYLLGVDPAPALATPGVDQVIELDNAVAVLAEGYWPAHKGLESLTPEWSLGERSSYDMDMLAEDLSAALSRDDAPTVREDGSIESAFEYAAATFEQTYEAPYLAHVCMEPMNATAWVRDGQVDVWMPGQGHSLVVDDVSAVLGVEKSAVRVHRTFLGGGFGRRGESDVAVQAALLSRAAGGRPVKLLWSREEDVRRDFYRPAAKTTLRVALGADKLPIGMEVQAASPSIAMRRFPQFVTDGKDPGALSGFLDSPYPLDHHRLRFAMVDNGVPVGFWRAVGHSQNVYFREGVISELAENAGEDGLSYRRRWLADNARAQALLSAVDEMSGYSQGGAAGISMGVALNVSHGSLCAHVIHISMTGESDFKVERIDCAIDPGVVVNPDGVVAQVESQALDGLSAALFGKVRLADGGAADSNFDTLRMLRLAEAPEVRVKVLEWDNAAPGGLGEPALPSVAPALTDAIFQATGQRIRRLPIIEQGLEVATA